MDETPEPVFLVLPDASYRLVYRVLMSDARLLDAEDGSIVWSHGHRVNPAATGIVGDRKNVGTNRAGGTSQAIDRCCGRPSRP